MRSPRDLAGSSRGRVRGLVALGILALPLVVTVGAFWPGLMNADSFANFGEIVSGDYTNWRAPLLNAIWHPFWLDGFGPGFVLAGQGVAFMFGTYLLMRAAFGPLGASVAAAAVAFSPAVLGMLGGVGRDTWYAALLVVAFGACARAAAHERARRWAWLVVALVAAWLALAARQNAAAAVVVVAGVIAVLALPRLAAPAARWRRLAGVVAGAVVLSLVLYGSQRAVLSTLHVQDRDPQQYIYVYDLAALSTRLGTNLLPRDVMPSGTPQTVARNFDVDTVNSYLVGPPITIRSPLPHPRVVEVQHAWRRAIQAHPVTYLGDRTRMFLRELGITRRALWVYHPNIDANHIGYQLRWPDRTARVRSYLDLFDDPVTHDGSLVDALWLYLLISAAAAWVLLRTRRGPLMVIGAMALSGLLFQSGLFFGMMSVQYRFEFPVVVTGTVSAIVLVRVAVGRALARRRARAGEEAAQPAAAGPPLRAPGRVPARPRA
jgi:hypothetical protein